MFYSAMNYPTTFSYEQPFAVHTRYSLEAVVMPLQLAARELGALPAGHCWNKT